MVANGDAGIAYAAHTSLPYNKIRAGLAWLNEAAAPNFNYLRAMRVTFVAAPSAH